MATNFEPWAQAWVPIVELCGLQPHTNLGAGNTAWAFSAPWHSLSPAAGLCCQAVLTWSASPWCPSWVVTEGDTDTCTCLALTWLPHKLSYESSWKSPYKPACPHGATKSCWPFEPELSDVSPTVMPHTLLSHRAPRVMLKTNVLQHLCENVAVCRYEKIVVIRQAVDYINVLLYWSLPTEKL